jgi:hypothetical protein
MDRYNSYSDNVGTNYQNKSGFGFGFVVILFVILSLLAIYYLYRYLYTSANSSATTLVRSQMPANMPPGTPPKGPLPSEGGEFSVNTWVYVNSFNKSRNRRKHIFEIQGQSFSTLLIALGAFKNTLTVRTHTVDVVQGFQSGGSGGSGSNTPTTTAPPNAGGSGTGKIGSLGAGDVNALFAPMAMDDDLLTTPLMCDLPEIDLQRWTMITVVISGRTIDVYLDGKLSRSCVTKSYFKVDPAGVTFNLLDRGGFDGYLGNTATGVYSMNPDEIYRMYLSGPQGSSMDIWKWIESLFRGTS